MQSNRQPPDEPVDPDSQPGGTPVGGQSLPPSIADALEAGDGSLRERLRHIACFSPPRPRYTLLGEVAEGAMGKVLRVWDELLQRELAMKVVTSTPRPGSDAGESEAHERSLSRFIEEARITGQLDHPGIVPVHEIALDGEGNVYFTMPLVRGHTLKHALELVRDKREGWTRHRALSVLHQVCMTVAFAHSRGVIHRDLKPENIMVGPFGETYTMDWGLALLDGRRERGVVVGTPAYMAPEQANAEGEVGPRADVYSLGAILYELLGGHVPHELTMAESANQTSFDRIILTPPRSIGKVVSGAPPELVAICDKAMSAVPDNRYATARELARDLQAWLEGRVVEAHETGRIARLRKWRDRNRLLSWSLEALVILGFMSGAALMIQQHDRIRTVEAKNARIDQESYAANLHAANLHLRVREMGDARTRLSACAPDLRGWEWDHLELSCDASAYILPHDGAARVAAVSDDYSLIATASDDGTVRLWSHRGELLHVLRGHTDSVRTLCFRPQSLQLASAGQDRTLRIWDAATGTALHSAAEHQAGILCVAYSEDGGLLATGDVNGVILIRETEGQGKIVMRLPSSNSPVSALVFEFGGKRLLAGDSSGTLRRWNIESGAVEREEIIANQTIRSIALARVEGSVAPVLIATAENLALQLHPERLVVTRRLAGHDGPVASVAIDAAGERVLTASGDHTVRMWDLASGDQTATFVGHTEDVNTVAFLDAGRFVSASEDNTARIWSSGAEAVFELTHDREWVTSLAFTEDGDRLVSASRDGKLRVWNARNGTLIETIATQDAVYCVDWMPDDRIVFGGWDDSLRILDPGTQAAWEVLRADDRFAASIDVDPSSGRILARYSDQSAFIWDPDQPTPGVTVRGLDDSNTAAFHPSGNSFATGTLEGHVTIYDASNGAVQRVLVGNDAPITALTYSSNGERIAAGTRDRSVLVWSTGSGDLLCSLRGHENRITSLAFSPDGTRLISGSADRTVRLWNPTTGEALLTLRSHTSAIMAVAFSPDGTQIASASKDGTARLWRTQATRAGTE